MKELTLLQDETEVLGSTPFDPAPEYSRAVMGLRLKSAELASQATQSALLLSTQAGEYFSLEMARVLAALIRFCQIAPPSGASVTPAPVTPLQSEKRA